MAVTPPSSTATNCWVSLRFWVKLKTDPFVEAIKPSSERETLSLPLMLPSFRPSTNSSRLFQLAWFSPLSVKSTPSKLRVFDGKSAISDSDKTKRALACFSVIRNSISFTSGGIVEAVTLERNDCAVTGFKSLLKISLISTRLAEFFAGFFVADRLPAPKLSKFLFISNELDAAISCGCSITNFKLFEMLSDGCR